MLDIHRGIGVHDLVVGQHFAGTRDGQRGQVVRMEQLDPFLPRAQLERLWNVVARNHQFFVVERDRHLRAMRDRLRDVPEVEQLHRALEAALAAGVNLDVFPVAAFETRRDQPLAAEARALAAGGLDVRDVLGMKPVIHRALRQQAVEQRRIDPLPATRHAPRTHGGQHADRRHETRAVTDMGMAEEDRAFATGTRLLGHDAKLRGDERVITRLVTPRALAAIRRDRADDESRKPLTQRVVIQPKGFGAPEPERLDEDIRLGQQPEQDLAIGVGADVQFHALLAAFPRQARQRVRVDPGARPFDLGYARAIVGEQQRGNAARHAPAGVDDGHSRERSHASPLKCCCRGGECRPSPRPVRSIFYANIIYVSIVRGVRSMPILDLFRLDGQVALITGGGGGLGGAIARAFADVGADVALVGRTRAPLELVQAEVEARGRRCAVIPADVTDPASAAEIVKATIAQLGKLTILVNNVGGLGGDEAPRPTMELTEQSWTMQVDLNLTSVWRLTKAAVPLMTEGGVILNMSSIKAFRPEGGSGAYAAAKAALNTMTMSLSQDLAPRFRVNGIAPGPVPTEKFKEVRKVSEADFDEVARQWGVPLGRLGRVDDIAATALFLASAAGSWVTGQTIIVAGGM